MIDVGTTIGRYELVARLRAGGMGTLFLGRRVGAAGFAADVAIKVVHPHLADDARFVRMFIDEALLSARIHHPNVVHVEDLGEHEGVPFLAMEYVEGCSLAELSAALRSQQRALSPETAVWIATQIADGLHAAHETLGADGAPLGVVHRDVSPHNVLIARSGHVKLIDFGIAKARGHGQHTQTGTLRGKLAYMSPEQAYREPVDRRADVYALGIVLWEMLTGRRMFDAADELELLEQVRAPHVLPPSAVAPEVPAALDEPLLRALSFAPDERPPTALAFRAELLAVCAPASSLAAGDLADLVAASGALRARPDAASAAPPTPTRAATLERLTRAHARPDSAVSVPVDPAAVAAPRGARRARDRRASALRLAGLLAALATAAAGGAVVARLHTGAPAPAAPVRRTPETAAGVSREIAPAEAVAPRAAAAPSVSGDAGTADAAAVMVTARASRTGRPSPTRAARPAAAAARATTAAPAIRSRVINQLPYLEDSEP